MVYTLKGRRYLKKYTASSLTPVYAAATDAQAMVYALCDIPWQEVSESHAQMAYHTEKMLDRNVEIRNRFDAVSFCANHVGGLHRAYANAACYVFELPDMETYPNLTSVKARVVSDPYNSGGVRLAVHVADTLDIPENCAIARTGVAHVEGVVPRETRIVNGAERWYAATDEVEIPVGVAAKKYLFLVVALEDYSIARGDWLEGSAFIVPTIEIVTDGELSSWSEDGVISAVSAREFVVLCEYDEPARVGYDDVSDVANGDSSSRAYVGADWYFPSKFITDTSSEDTPSCKVSGIEDWIKGASFDDSREADLSRNINCCYAAMFANRLRPAVPQPASSYNPFGAAFTVGRGAGYAPYFSKACSIHRRKLLIPFSTPGDFRSSKVRLTWEYSNGIYDDVRNFVMRYNLWFCRGRAVESYEVSGLQDFRLWTASTEKVGEWELLVSKNGECGGKNTLSYCEEVDLQLSGRSRHTFMCTCYIPPESFSLEDASAFENGNFALGMGWDNATVRIFGSMINMGGGVSRGWAPGITLLS